MVIEDRTPASGNLQANNVTPVGGLFRAAVGLYESALDLSTVSVGNIHHSFFAV